MYKGFKRIWFKINLLLLKQVRKSMMKREEGYFRGFNDSELFYQSWIVKNPAGVIIITHGLGEHSECYQRLVDGLAPLQFNIYGWDLRGHGRSEGKRGVASDLFDFCEDMKIFFKHVKAQQTGLPIFLLGHSMGGLICNRALLAFEDLQPEGLVLSSPLCKPIYKPSQIQLIGAKFLAKWFPAVTLKTQSSPHHLTKDKDILREYTHDHLRHDKISPNLFFDFLLHGQYLLENASQIQLPVIVLQSGEDKLVSHEATQSYFKKIHSKDKTFKLYEGYLHELFNEVKRQVVYSDLMDWFKDQIKKHNNSSKK